MFDGVQFFAENDVDGVFGVLPVEVFPDILVGSGVLGNIDGGLAFR